MYDPDEYRKLTINQLGEDSTQKQTHWIKVAVDNWPIDNWPVDNWLVIFLKGRTIGQ